MKELLLIRHAKSSWKEDKLSDFERSLNNRGLRDAPFMGQLLKKKNIFPDLIISSPANRAITTARMVAEEIDYPSSNILEEVKIYEADTQDIFNILKNTDNDKNRIFLFGHNPSITFFANKISKNLRIDNIPTCGIVYLKFEIQHWSEIEYYSADFIEFEFPKKYLS